MTIIKMTATFGKLSQQTLTLTPNFNVFTLPNEAGKSTWTSFLLAMFYGVDTSERSSQSNLPVKKKYQPWSGESMSGVIELLHEGRHITIERTARGAVPFGAFRAYDTESGQDILELTAENCGSILLGCEKSVFVRSALLTQNAMSISSDDALRQRLISLVSTGSETVNYDAVHGVLHKASLRIKNSLLPQAQSALSAVNDALEKIHAQHRSNLSLQTEIEKAEAEQAHLAALSEAFAYEEAMQKKQQRTDAEQLVRRAEQTAASLQEQLRALPEKSVLQTLQKELFESPALPEPPAADAETAVFAGLSEEKALQQAQQDAAAYDRLLAKPRKSPVLQAVLTAVFVLAAPLLCWLLKTPLGLLTLLGAACFGFLTAKTLRNNKTQAEHAAAAQKILEKYGLTSRDEIITAGARYAAAKRTYDAQLSKYEAAVSTEKERTARLMGQVSMFCPDCATPEAALQAVNSALTLYEQAEAAEQTLAFSKKQYAAVCEALGDDAALSPPQVDVLGWTKQSAAQKMQQTAQRLTELNMQLAANRGFVKSLGNPAELLAQKEALEARIAQLMEQQDAFSLAEKTLQDANAQMQNRFSPQLCQLAGSILEKLTQNRYNALTLDGSMRATARESGSALTRELAYLSSGTADQVYLALRLAIAALALPAHTPLILDDALIRFDDVRLKTALTLLQEQSKTRQIILFSCHDREAAFLKGESL